MTAWHRPPALRRGGVVGVVAPSGPVDPARLSSGLTVLRDAGLEVVLGRGLLERRHFLAGDDAVRAADLAAMLADTAIDAVLCARGGYGAMRLLPALDERVRHLRPKLFAGFSDITALHLLLGAHGWVTFHGPVLECGSGEAPRANLAALVRALGAEGPLGPLTVPPGAPVPRSLHPGRAAGRLVGGNLSLLAATLGTPWEVRTEGCLLLLEEVGERPYQLDRYLSQLWLAGKLQAASGYLIGQLVDCRGGPGDPDPLEVFAERLVPLAKPCLADLPFGHGPVRSTLPLGVRAELDADAGRLTVLEAAAAPLA